MAGLDIKLDRFDRVYRLGEQVQGLIAINAESGFAFNCIVLRAEGNMQFQMPSKGAGMLDSLVSSLKPVDLLQKEVVVKDGGRVSRGMNTFPFKFTVEPILKGRGHLQTGLFETYHGLCCCIQYLVIAEVQRPMLAKNITIDVEFIVEIPGTSLPKSLKDIEEPIEFNITELSDTIAFTRDLVDAGFKAKCTFSKRAFALGGYLQGSFILEKRAIVPIRSIDIRVSRMETFRLNDQLQTDDSDVVVLQMADGDLDVGIEVPIHILIPRLYVCPTTDSPEFGIKFKAYVDITFNASPDKKGRRPTVSAGAQVDFYRDEKTSH